MSTKSDLRGKIARRNNVAVKPIGFRTDEETRNMTTETATEAKAEAKTEAKKPSVKGTKPNTKAKPETTPVQTPEQEGEFLEATEAYHVVLELAPETEALAKQRTDEARELVNGIDVDRTKIGYYVLAMRRRTKSAGDEAKNQKQARAHHNGFGLAGFKNEAEWGYSIGLVERGSSGEYNTNRLSQSVLAAELDMQLRNAGVDGGIEVLGKGARGAVMRGSRRIVNEVVPLIVGLAEEGKLDGIDRAVEKKIAEVRAPREEVTVSSLATDELVTRAARKADSITRLADGMWSDRISGAIQYLEAASKRKGLTPDAEKILAGAKKDMLKSLANMVRVAKGE